MLINEIYNSFNHLWVVVESLLGLELTHQVPHFKVPYYVAHLLVIYIKSVHDDFLGVVLPLNQGYVALVTLCSVLLGQHRRHLVVPLVNICNIVRFVALRA